MINKIVGNNVDKDKNNYLQDQFGFISEMQEWFTIYII